MKNYYPRPFFGDDLNLSMVGHCISIYYLPPKPWPEGFPYFINYYVDDACVPTTFNLQEFNGINQKLPSDITDFMTGLFLNKDTIRYAMLKSPRSFMDFVLLWNTVQPIVQKYKSPNRDSLGNELRMTKKDDGIAIFYVKSYTYSNTYPGFLSIKQKELSLSEKYKYWYQEIIVELKDKPLINIIPLMLILMFIIDIRTIRKINISRNIRRQLTSGSS
jgi:hypothetical protein